MSWSCLLSCVWSTQQFFTFKLFCVSASDVHIYILYIYLSCCLGYLSVPLLVKLTSINQRDWDINFYTWHSFVSGFSLLLLLCVSVCLSDWLTDCLPACLSACLPDCPSPYVLQQDHYWRNEDNNAVLGLNDTDATSGLGAPQNALVVAHKCPPASAKRKGRKVGHCF